MEPDIACERLMARNALPKEEAAKRIGAQMSNEEHVARAAVVLPNNGSVDEFIATVRIRGARC